MARNMTATPHPRQCAKARLRAKILRGFTACSAKMLTANKRSSYPSTMQQTQPGDPERSAGGGAMSKASSAKDRVDSALSRLESMVEERLRSEQRRSDELAKRLSRLEEHHEELRKVAHEVEGRLERAMEYIRSLLAADQN
jgi:chromosome segregation ATPase